MIHKLDLNENDAYLLLESFSNRYNNIRDEIKSLEETIEHFNFFIHMLKGTASNIYLNEIETLCIELEKNKNFINKILLDRLIDEVETNVENINSYITPLIKRK